MLKQVGGVTDAITFNVNQRQCGVGFNQYHDKINNNYLWTFLFDIHFYMAYALKQNTHYKHGQEYKKNKNIADGRLPNLEFHTKNYLAKS